MKAILKTKQGVSVQDKRKPRLVDNFSVLIKINLAGLCRTDIFVAQDKITVPNGRILGHEFSGTVEEVGSSVDKEFLGRRVAVFPIIKKDIHSFSMLGIHADGAFAEYIVVNCANVYLVPDSLSDKEAAFLEPIAASLAVIKAPIYPYQKGLIYGYNRFSDLIYRILKIKGFNNIETMASVGSACSDNTYDFIIETEPSARAFEHMLRLIKPQGVIVLKSRPYASVPIPFHSIVKKELHLVGTHYGNFQEGIELVATKQLVVSDLLGAEYSFSEAIDILSRSNTASEHKKLFFKP